MAGLVIIAAHADDLHTRDGTVYHNYKVIGHDADSITIMYAEGGGKIPLSKLPDDLQKKYGYQPGASPAAVTAAPTPAPVSNATLPAPANAPVAPWQRVKENGWRNPDDFDAADQIADPTAQRVPLEWKAGSKQGAIPPMPADFEPPQSSPLSAHDQRQIDEEVEKLRRASDHLDLKIKQEDHSPEDLAGDDIDISIVNNQISMLENWARMPSPTQPSTRFGP